MKPARMALSFLLLALLALCPACKVQHTKTIIEEPDGGRATEHSVELKEIITDEEKGVELYNSRDEEDPGYHDHNDH